MCYYSSIRIANFHLYTVKSLIKPNCNGSCEIYLDCRARMRAGGRAHARRACDFRASTFARPPVAHFDGIIELPVGTASRLIDGERVGRSMSRRSLTPSNYFSSSLKFLHTNVLKRSAGSTRDCERGSDEKVFETADVTRVSLIFSMRSNAVRGYEDRKESETN